MEEMNDVVSSLSSSILMSGGRMRVGVDNTMMSSSESSSSGKTSGELRDGPAAAVGGLSGTVASVDGIRGESGF